MSWGGLNPALTAYRNAINLRLPNRGRHSDGGYADLAHGSTSQHQPDADGTVDAFDMDVNLLASSAPIGSAAELQLIEALKLDFEQDPYGRGQLWIHHREIANRDVDNWRERGYSGDNPHTQHVHWQSRQSREHIAAAWPLPRFDHLLGVMFMTPAQEAKLDRVLAALDQLPADVWNHRESNPNPQPGRIPETTVRMGGVLRTQDNLAERDREQLLERIDALAADQSRQLQQVLDLLAPPQ